MAAIELLNTPLFHDPNLVSYWRLEGNSNDSKDSNNGTDTNITYSSGNGKFGQGAGFNSLQSSTINLNNPTNLKITSPFTLCAWINRNNTGQEQGIVGQWNIESSIYSGMYLIIDGPSQCLEFLSMKNTGTTLGTDFQYARGATVITAGVWFHVAGVWDGNNLIVYVDGVSDGSVAWANAPVYKTTSYSIIGLDYVSTDNNRHMNGSLDDVAVFNRALTATEIYNLYSGNWTKQQIYQVNQSIQRASRW